MNKQEFLDSVARGIAGLSPEDVTRWTEYYREMLEDRIEDGMSEEEAVAAMGKPGEVVEEIIAQTPIRALVKERVKPKRRLTTWEILLIALGSPIWLALLLSAFAVILAVFVTLWSLVISAWAIEVSLGACSLAGIGVGAIKLCTGEPSQAFFMLGAALALAGLFIFGIWVCKLFTRLMLACSKGFLLLIKRMLMGKRGNGYEK